MTNKVCENCLKYREDIRFCGQYYQEIQHPTEKPWWCSTFFSKQNREKDVQKKLI